MKRRDFLKSAVGVGALGAGSALIGTQVRRALAQEGLDAAPKRFIAIGSWNALPGVKVAVEQMRKGVRPVEAAVAGVALTEDNPDDSSVGLGGLPNEDGIVELDACVMDGPSHKCGGVGALRDIRNPAAVALRVMDLTDHVLIVGEGARRFAIEQGFQPENLLTDASRKEWLKWKTELSPNDNRLSVPRESKGGGDAPDFTWGTVNLIAMNDAGDLGGTTSTSGRSYKIPGRVGDSPIIGAGLYVDNEVGGCGSTGRGEANLINCSCFLVVELMRQGRTPDEAVHEVLQRVARRTESRLRNDRGEPDYQLKFYALRKDGMYGGAVMREGGEMSVFDGDAPRTVKLPAIYA